MNSMKLSVGALTIAALAFALAIGLWISRSPDIASKRREDVSAEPPFGRFTEAPAAPRPDTTTDPHPTPESSQPRDTRPPEATLVPLENLLRVPESSAFPHLDPGHDQESETNADVEGPTRDARRVHIDASSTRDTLEEDPEQTRQQVDAGASVKVNESTRIRGGVRIERDPDSAVTKEVETAPMIGVEKRF
jgi:hypothetical protein